MLKPKVILLLLFLTTALACLILYFLGSILVSPKPSIIGTPPQELPIEVVRMPKGNNESTQGWFLKGEPDKAGILLLHGVKSDRLEMLDRARFLFSEGYSVLLIDMQAHGETPGEHLTFGVLESIDAHIGLAYLKGRVENNKTAVIGSSMGGASALLGQHPLDADAVVIEGVYATLEEAIANRIAIRLGQPAKILTPLLSLQLEPRLGISLDSVAPVKAISQLQAPVLIISGAQDKHALPSEAQAIYDNANQPKSLWIVDGASHEDIHKFDSAKYEE